MNKPLNHLDELVEAVRTGARYRAIDASLVRQIGEHELAVRRNFKEAVKATRSLLHQIGGAFQEKPVPYEDYTSELSRLPHDLASPDVRNFCLEKMTGHASTRERLPILADFYRTLLAPLAPIRSLADLACGLNPLSLPWMPVDNGTKLFACDIYTDMVNFLQTFFDHMQLNGRAQVCDLTTCVLPEPVQVALLLKTLPCLEHLEKDIGRRLLSSLPAEHLVVSFPVRSLGGRAKGMAEFYENRFLSLLDGSSWQAQIFHFSNELAFLLSR